MTKKTELPVPMKPYVERTEPVPAQHLQRAVKDKPRLFRESNRRRVIPAMGIPRVKSEFAQETDINRIVARIKRTGDMSRLNLDRTWEEVDLTNLPTNFTDAAMLLKSVQDKFMALDSETRHGYHNDPENWVKDLQAQQVARGEAQKAAKAAQAEEAAAEAAYRKNRREAVKNPPKKED